MAIKDAKDVPYLDDHESRLKALEKRASYTELR